MAAVTETVVDQIRHDVPQRTRLDFTIRQTIAARTPEADQGPAVVPVVTIRPELQKADYSDWFIGRRGASGRHARSCSESGPVLLEISLSQMGQRTNPLPAGVQRCSLVDYLFLL
jgi:hypothetical protein